MRIETKYRILVISMFVILMMFGIYIGFNYEKNKSASDIATTVMNNNENTQDKVHIYSEENNKKYDIEVIYETYYSLCMHGIDDSSVIQNSTLSQVKENELKKQNEKNELFEIKEENKDRIVFYRTLEQNCPNHFKIINENGSIVIYNLVNETVSTVYKKLDMSGDLIRPELLEELNQGIIVDSKEELNLIIEDLES